MLSCSWDFFGARAAYYHARPVQLAVRLSTKPRTHGGVLSLRIAHEERLEKHKAFPGRQPPPFTSLISGLPTEKLIWEKPSSGDRTRSKTP